MSLIRSYSYPVSTSNSWVETLTNIITESRGLSGTVIKIGFTSIVWLGLSNAGLTLEHQLQDLAESPQSQLIAQNNIIFVNPATAQTGNGSDRAPFKTITQALVVALPNSTIILAPGTYSSDSGETFPLKLKQGISIQGDSSTKGKNIVIKGGGTFLSSTFAKQNITILGANQAEITGVTITNPNPRGYGLWIESSSLLVSNNTFIGNSHDGISITGNSAPIIQKNYFGENKANGITIYGTSQPQVRENVFEKTGFGINIAQKAAPILVGNQIRQNRSGIIAQANSRPVLRGNIIEGNQQDGLVAIANSQPDLGTKIAPGGNIFRQNGGYDINSITAKQTIPAFGNQLKSDRTQGKIDFTGITAINPVPLPATPRLAQVAPSARIINPVETQSLAVSSRSESTSVFTSTSAIPIPVPPPITTTLESSPLPRQGKNSNTPRLATASGSDTAMTLSVPPAPDQLVIPPPGNSSFTQGLPELEAAPIVTAELLPVPSPNIPIGNSRNLPKVQGSKNSLAPSAGSPPLPPTRASSLGLRYRVVVETKNANQQKLVRSIVPGAFRTFSNGRVFMQVGAFSERSKADEMLQLVNSKGLRGVIEQI